MNRKNRVSRRHFWQMCASQLVTASLFTLAFPTTPVSAGVDQFQICAAELLRAGISRENAARTCAEALYPKDLSLCVLKIEELTPVAADEALFACMRVRRPKELASCMVNINQRTQGSDPLLVLANCRSTIRPLRFSECVIGLSREIDFSLPSALATCIDAEDFPR